MLQIINYSEKAVAVIGDTKDHADELKALGGRFNSRLTCGAGWIFSKKVLSELEALANGKMEPKKNEALKDMRVYVGTYHKYNNGSIEGKWLELSDYANRDEFYAACRELHKDESDPEFMFQDYEGVPSWMIGESHIDAEVWEWKPEPDNGKQTIEQKRAILEKCGCKGDIDYYAKSSALIVEAKGRYFDISKPTIETRFCHADEPEDEVKAWYKVVRTFEYFRRENMKDLNKAIKTLSETPINGTLDGLFICKSNYTGMWGYGVNSDRYYLRAEDEAAPMDEKTRQALLKGYKQIAKDFEKRLSAWWKRYGAEKLHVWTYWRDA